MLSKQAAKFLRNLKIKAPKIRLDEDMVSRLIDSRPVDARALNKTLSGRYLNLQNALRYNSRDIRRQLKPGLDIPFVLDNLGALKLKRLLTTRSKAEAERLIPDIERISNILSTAYRVPPDNDITYLLNIARQYPGRMHQKTGKNSTLSDLGEYAKTPDSLIDSGPLIYKRNFPPEFPAAIKLLRTHGKPEPVTSRLSPSDLFAVTHDYYSPAKRLADTPEMKPLTLHDIVRRYPYGEHVYKGGTFNAGALRPDAPYFLSGYPTVAAGYASYRGDHSFNVVPLKSLPSWNSGEAFFTDHLATAEPTIRRSAQSEHKTFHNGESQGDRYEIVFPGSELNNAPVHKFITDTYRLPDVKDLADGTKYSDSLVQSVPYRFWEIPADMPTVPDFRLLKTLASYIQKNKRANPRWKFSPYDLKWLSNFEE